MPEQFLFSRAQMRCVPWRQGEGKAAASCFWQFDQRPADARIHGGRRRGELIVLHNDAAREYAYGARPAHALYNEAKKEDWFVVSMKNDLEAHLRVRITN
jgi:hypothetical protein